jgi:glycolate oxidase FAD binding subunit
MQDALNALSQQVRAAAQSKRALRIEGGGSKQFYGQPVAGETLYVNAYHGIVEHEPSELVATVRAGTPLAELQAALADKGQMLAFEPPHFGAAATIGGCVATGLSGPARAYRGSVRDFLLGVKIIDGKGDALKFGGKVIKNVAGYDVSRLMVGACGTLGVITEVSFKVLPLPKHETTLQFEMDEARAIQAMNEWAGQPLPLSATCYADNKLWVRLSGTESGIAAASAKLGGNALDNATAFWQAVREQTFFDSASGNHLWRVCVPSTTPPLELAGKQIIEWGGALRWIVTGEANTEAIRAAAQRAGGHATRFRGPTSSDVFHPLPAALERIHARLKHTFDPHGVLNPGRMYEAL